MSDRRKNSRQDPLLDRLTVLKRRSRYVALSMIAVIVLSLSAVRSKSKEIGTTYSQLEFRLFTLGSLILKNGLLDVELHSDGRIFFNLSTDVESDKNLPELMLVVRGYNTKSEVFGTVGDMYVVTEGLTSGPTHLRCYPVFNQIFAAEITLACDESASLFQATYVAELQEIVERALHVYCLQYTFPSDNNTQPKIWGSIMVVGQIWSCVEAFSNFRMLNFMILCSGIVDALKVKLGLASDGTIERFRLGDAVETQHSQGPVEFTLHANSASSDNVTGSLNWEVPDPAIGPPVVWFIEAAISTLLTAVAGYAWKRLRKHPAHRIRKLR